MAGTLKFAIPVAWNMSRAYEQDTIVFIGKRAYTAKQDVPMGIEIANTDYWAETGVPFADVQAIYNRLNAAENDIRVLETDMGNAQEDIVTNANNIAQITENLSQTVNNLTSQVARIDNIMITLYTPVTNEQEGE